MKIRRLVAPLIFLACYGLSLSSFAAVNFGLKCQLIDTQDHFVFYPSQLVFQSEQFALFQNFKGRVVTQVDVKTSQMIRTTYLGVDYTPQYQILFGRCNKVTETLSLWRNEQVSLHSLN
ncbi:hypothetical protein [Vibrio sp. qd031]|uniref:hypothetical protein n=1 Tax=Vibrio sp. qd031 TaxID=1603038 RepID=UPI000A11779B|nr:hypothetical protein [Vibrio sp. qd031]